MKGLFVLMLLFVSHSCCARVETSIQPNPAVMGQELQLIIRQYDKQASSTPDFSQLQQDFTLIGSQQSISYQLINGKSQRENIWTLMLMPKHAGKLHIPELSVGDEKTSGMDIEVQQQAPQANKVADAHVSTFLNWDVRPKHPMVHEQVKLTLKIYHLQPLLDAKLQPPAVKNGMLFSLEQGLRYFEMQSGVRYEVEEYRYVIYPQQAGNMEISPPALDAIEYGLAPAPVHTSLNPMTVQVMPLPKEQALASWLPAQQLTFKDLKPFSRQIGIPVGDTLVRQLQITAVGMPAQLMPDIQVSCGDGCKVYMNPAKISNKIQNGSLSGRKIYDITYLLRRSGKQIIPAIHIPWFNTQTRRLEQLSIPGLEVDVFAVTPQQHAEQPPAFKPGRHLPAWWFAIFGFLGGGLFIKFQSHCPWKKWLMQLRGLELEHASLKKACLQHNPEQARLEILVWAKKLGFDKPIIDLHDVIANIPDGDFSKELEVLMHYLFSARQQKKWHGSGLWRAFKAFKFTQQEVMPPKHPFDLNP